MSEVDEEPLSARDRASGADPASEWPDREPVDPDALDSEPLDSEPLDSEPLDSPTPDSPTADSGRARDFSHSEPFDSERFGRAFEVGAIDGDPFDGEPYDDDLLDGEHMETRPARRPRRHIGRYVIAVAVVLVVGAGIVVGPNLWRVYSARHTKLTLPETVAGLSRDTSADSEDTASYLRDAVGSSTSLSNPLAAVYDAGGDKTRSVLLFGGTGAIFRPESTLSTVLGLVDDSGDALQGLRTMPPGPLGGVLKCGVSPGSGPADPDLTVCGWADHGSVVAALFPGRSVDEAADLARQFRAAVETR